MAIKANLPAPKNKDNKLSEPKEEKASSDPAKADSRENLKAVFGIPKK